VNDKTIVVPPYLTKLLDLLEANPPIQAGRVWTVKVAHDATCPMSTDARAECCCDPDVRFAERRAVWVELTMCRHPLNGRSVKTRGIHGRKLRQAGEILRICAMRGDVSTKSQDLSGVLRS
jgi:hypothetical protein